MNIYCIYVFFDMSNGSHNNIGIQYLWLQMSRAICFLSYRPLFIIAVKVQTMQVYYHRNNGLVRLMLTEFTIYLQKM